MLSAPNKAFFLCLGLAISLQPTSMEAGRRRPSNEELKRGAVIDFLEETKEVHITYDVLSPSRGLHREALKAFHHGEYEHARACFGLALKASPKSEDLILNYALFSMVVPWMEGRSLHRARGLLDQIHSEKGKADPRYTLANEIYAWLSPDLEPNPNQLNAMDHPHFSKVAQELQQHWLQGKEIIDESWSKDLLPLRLAPREKRERR